jgi:CubicO group peptidase (beta-lactamase class C family)
MMASSVRRRARLALGGLAALTLLVGRIALAEGQAEGTVAALTAGLRNQEAAVRERSALELGKAGPGAVAAIEPLVEVLADVDPYVAGAAAEALRGIGAESVPALSRALGDARENVRVGAAIALGKLGWEGREAVRGLVRALSDPKENVRWCAVNALGAAGAAASAAVPALREALHDADEDVRRGAALALERIDRSGWLRAPSWEATVATIERLTPLLMRELHVPGVSIALVRDRKIAWTRSWGVADVRTGAPVTVETLFEAASMTKPVFASSVLKLVEQGRIDLDRPLSEYAAPPSVPFQQQRLLITPRMVLSHTSGLPNWRKGGEERDGPLPVLFTPGSRFGYSGEAIFQLQRVVEKVTGEPIEEHAARTLFAPLGMASTSYVWTAGLDSRLASGHKADGSFLARARYTHANAAYSLVTTASDYARLLVAILDPEGSAPHGPSRASVASMLRQEVRVDVREPIERPGRAKGGEVFWGLGWSLNTTVEGEIVHHSGANSTGFRSFSQFAPGRGTGIVILTNGLSGGELWTRLVSVVGDL